MHREHRAANEPRGRAARLDARWKLLAAVAIILLASMTPHGLWPVADNPHVSYLHIAIALLLAVVFPLSRVSWRDVAWRGAFFGPVLLLIVFSIPLARGWDASWQPMLGVLARTALSFATLLLLICTTRFEALLRAFSRLGMPRLLVAVLSFMYRYVFVLLDELQRMRSGRQARTFTAHRPWSLRVTASLVGVLVLRSLDRAERVHAAMRARGFDGTIRTLDD